MATLLPVQVHLKPKPYTGPLFPMMQVLELACAAQRVNGAYIKEDEPVYSDDGKVMFYKKSNRGLIAYTIDPPEVSHEVITPLEVTDEDREFAVDIKKYFRKLMFAAVEGSSQFLTDVNSILNSEEVGTNKFGYIASLPKVYRTDYSVHRLKKVSETLDEGYLGSIGEVVEDLDAEIMESYKSKNFDGWNITAIINNKMASWIGKKDLKIGPAVIVRARVKDYSKHYKHGNPVTRLHYVKAAQ